VYAEHKTQQQFEELVAHTRRHCELLLKGMGVKGAVHCRTKNSDSLGRKLRDLKNDSSLKPSFRDWVLEGNDIYEHPDMGDLVGVRIGLYFPTDVAKVEERIKDNFEQIHSFGTVTGGRLATSRGTDVYQYGRGRWYTIDANNAVEYWNHSGYESWQMVVKGKNPLRDSLKSVRVGMHERFKSLKFEIQVGTVVSQAWAEVQHNILYKRPDNVLATSAMKGIIDAMNGLAITTDILLKELARSLEDAKTEVEAAKQKRQENFLIIDKRFRGLNFRSVFRDKHPQQWFEFMDEATELFNKMRQDNNELNDDDTKILMLKLDTLDILNEQRCNIS
jgi:ppGpp synthetase/RelA/SpoT-type nucleotidyltranferase